MGIFLYNIKIVSYRYRNANLNAYETVVPIGIHATDHHGTQKTRKDKNENVFLLKQLCVILPSFYLTIFCI